jgi:hypothetical protein
MLRSAVTGNWLETVNSLRQAAETGPLERIPDLLAELERAKATAYARLLAPQNSQPSDADAPPNENDSVDELMTPDEVAQYLKVDLSWVYRHNKELQGSSLSDRCLRFRRSIVDRHLDRCRGR